MSLLPNISKETLFHLSVRDAKIEYEGETLELDFTGQIRQVVVPFPDEPADRVQLWIRDQFELSGSGNGLYVVFGEGEHDRNQPSWVRVVQESPRSSSSAMSSSSRLPSQRRAVTGSSWSPRSRWS